MSETSPLFTTRVRRALPDLHPSERRLADMVLNFPGDLASYTASELAQLADVSNATVTRFIRKLDYSNYDEARRHVRQNREEGASLFRASSDALAEHDFWADQIIQTKYNLDGTFTQITEREISSLAEAVLHARTVWIVGTRRSHAFAQYLSLQLQQVVTTIRMVPTGPETLSEALSGVAPEDCVIVFGLRRPLRALPAILRQMAETEARIAYIYDLDAVPDLSLEWRLPCETASAGPLFNHASVITLCHLIATIVLSRASEAGRVRMGTIEALHDAFGEV